METKMLGPTGIDSNQYSVGNGTLYTTHIYNWLNGITCFHSLAYKMGSYRDAQLIKNPMKYRYNEDGDVTSNAMLVGGPAIGQRGNVYENIDRQIVFLDDEGGLSGHTLTTYEDGDENNQLFRVLNNSYSGKTNYYTDEPFTINEYTKENGNLPVDAYKNIPSDFKDSTIKFINNVKTTEHYDEVEMFNNTEINSLYGTEDKFSGFKDEKTLLYKTNELFKRGKINSLVSRFSSVDKGNEGILPQKEISQSALDNTYGMSRGRNLKSTDNKIVNGYNNPYCRVWTSHHQYSSYNDTIRNGSFNALQKNNLDGTKLRPKDGIKRLREYSVMDENGNIRFTPYSDDYSETKLNEERVRTLNKSKIKKCMFSIENLAWKDVKAIEEVNVEVLGSTANGFSKATENGIALNTKYKVKTLGNRLSKEQTGPNGGRIMWFPPYDLSFTENVNVEWESSTFIGRGEPIYTYKNTERTGTLDFTILIDHPSVVSQWVRENGNTISDEETLLRFFAGCQPLEIGRDKDEEEINTESYYEAKVEDIIKEVEEIPPYNAKVKLYVPVFFPNGYSGSEFVKQEGKESATEGLLKMLKGGEGDNEGYETVVDISGNRKVDFETDKGRYNTTAYTDTKAYGLNTDYLVRKLSGDTSVTAITDDMVEFLKPVLNLQEETVKTNIVSFNNLMNISSIDELKTMAANIDNTAKNKTIESFEWDIEATIKGCASSHGDEETNKSLFTSRADILRKYLVNKFGINNISTEKGDIIEVDSVERSNKSHYKAKIGRNAVVVFTFTMKEIQGPNDENNVEVEKKYSIDSSQSESHKNQILSQISATYKDYNSWDNEYKYFDSLKSENKLIFEKITDKLKYFNPAFHSITPEGFNGRLNFLHQCTRQGPTVSAADKNGEKTMGAGNLSFGRPPFCILRIGDFYNTKICITSMSINYDIGNGIQWDLNPEGVGVQPMFAKITLGITFLGGSDIEGPIEKLQNAITANYYANTSIYDKNSDSISAKGSNINDYEFVDEKNKKEIEKRLENNENSKEIIRDIRNNHYTESYGTIKKPYTSLDKPKEPTIKLK